MLASQLFGLPAFSNIELTAVIRQIAYMPGLLGAYGESLFRRGSSASPYVAMAKEDTYYSLIPTSPRGSPPVELEKRPGDMRVFQPHRLAKGSTLYFDSLTGALQGPEYRAVANVMTEFASRGARIRQDHEYTKEYMRFGAVLGRVLDADGSVLDDYFNSWGAAQSPFIEIPLNDPAANLRMFLMAVIRSGERNSKGGWVPNRTQYHAMAGDEFFDKLVTHPSVERTYLYYSAAAELRREVGNSFDFGGVIWHNFRGSDDGVTMAIQPEEAYLFPVGANGAFHEIYGPAEFEPWINQPGEEIYALTIPDRDRNAHIRFEAYSYPLMVCARPDMLRRMKIGAGSSSSSPSGEEEET